MKSIDYLKIHSEMHIEQRLSLTEISTRVGINRNTISRNFIKRGLQVIRHTKTNYSEINLSAFEIWSPEMAYWLGFITADGSVSKDSNYIHVTLKESDIEHLKRLQKFLNLPTECLRYAPCQYKGETRMQAKLSFSHEKVKNQLLKVGIVPRKSFLDINYLNYIPKNYWMYFIIGFFDGDGSFVQSRISFNIIGSKSFMECIERYFVSEYNFSHVNVKLSNQNKLYSIRWHATDDVLKFARLHSTILGDLPLKRKLDYSKKVTTCEVYPRCTDCGKNITIYSVSNLCSKCSSKSRRIVERPTKEELSDLLSNSNYSAIGREYKISGNTVKKWAKQYQLI